MSKKNDIKTEELDLPVPSLQPTTEIPTNLDLNDISKLIKLIDIASEKGIFKPADFVSIGQTYIKLVQILQTTVKS